MFGDVVADELFDLRDHLFGQFDARAARGADGDLEGAGVDFGEEIAPQ